MEDGLLNPVFLCNDFLVKSLLGVAPDVEDHILITCKAVVKQFNVLDRRQVRSWTTKSWRVFSSTAVYDPNSKKIVAVFNGNSISKWTHNTVDLEEVKNFNFETPIHQLLVSSGKVFIIFKTGEVGELSSSIQTRKDKKPGFLQEDEKISYVQLLEGVVVIVTNREKCTKLYKIQLDSQGGQLTDSYELAVKDATLMGLCALSKSPSAKLITFWSNGDLYSMDLKNTPLQCLPGKKHAKETQIVATKPVKILDLSPTHIAIIGMAAGDDGGIIVMRDTAYCMTVSKRKLKMYRDPPMACTSPNGIVALDGCSLSLIPTHITESSLASVFGSKMSQNNEFTAEHCRSWNISSTVSLPEDAQSTVYTKRSSELVQIMRKLQMDGVTESILVSELVKCLLEKKRLHLLVEVMETFNDIPESSLVDVLGYYLDQKDSDFKGISDIPSFKTRVAIGDKEEKECVCPISSKKAHVINGILRKPFTDMQLLSHLHRINFSNTVTLIEYMYFLIVSEQALLYNLENPQLPSVEQVTLWLSLILDTNYNQLIMTAQDSIHQLLEMCFAQISKTQKTCEALMEIEALATRVVTMPVANRVNNLYSIEAFEVE